MAFSTLNSIQKSLIRNNNNVVTDKYIFEVDPSLVLYYPLNNSTITGSIKNVANFASGFIFYDGIVYGNANISYDSNTFSTNLGNLSLNNTIGSTATQYINSVKSFNLVPSTGMAISCWFSCSGQLNTTSSLFSLPFNNNGNAIEIGIKDTNMIYSDVYYNPSSIYSSSSNVPSIPLISSITSTSSSITINYNSPSQNSSNVSGYQLQQIDGTTLRFSQYSSNTRSIFVSALIPLKTHSFVLSSLFTFQSTTIVANSVNITYNTILDPPSNISIISTETTANTIQIYFTEPYNNGNAITYTISTGTLISQGDSYYIISGLSPNTLYNISIFSSMYYSGTTTIGTSSVVYIPSFTTLANPPSNVIYIANSITSTSISFTFTPPSGSVSISYTSNIGTLTYGTFGSNTITISGFNFDFTTNYSIQIASVNTSGTSTYVSAISYLQLYTIYNNRNLYVYYPFDTSLNKLTPNIKNILSNNVQIIYDASFIGNATLTTNSIVGSSALSLTNIAFKPASSYVLRNQINLVDLSSSGFTITCWINTLGLNNTDVMCLFDMPYDVKEKGISVNISSNTSIYSTTF